MRQLAERLVHAETSSGAGLTRGRAALSVCEKLRKPLSTYAGAAGFRSLSRRALGLATVTHPWLSRIVINPDGSIELFEALDTDADAAASAGVELVTQLLTLLVTFIGEVLTLRIVHEVWPKAALKNLKSGGKSV